VPLFVLDGIDQMGAEFEGFRGILDGQVHELALGPEGHADWLSEQGVLNGIHGLSLSE